MASRDGSKLPAKARATLAAPIRDAINAPSQLRSSHTVPIRREVWSVYADILRNRVAEFEQTLVDGPGFPPDFSSLRQWLEKLLISRNRVLSHTLAMAPFEYFDDDGARHMLGLVDSLLFQVSNELGNHGVNAERESLRASANWELDFTADGVDVVARTFKVDSEHARDVAGRFNPSSILAFYYLRNGSLIQIAVLHLRSLGLPNSGDLLVAISAIGWIVDADDPIAAYSSMDAFMNALMKAYGTEVLESALQYIRAAGPALRQGRARINRAIGDISAAESSEDRNLHLADVYKRLIEGPFRRYSWAFHSLNVGNWSEPPMLTELRDRIVSNEGWLGDLTMRVVLREVRNGEAHESLYWDGLIEKFVVDGLEIEAQEVVHAAVLADAFCRGCESAIASYEALKVEHKPGVPQVADLGRLEPWRRAEAFFGTNGIRMVRADFNTKVAKIICTELRRDSINPCLQALMLCHSMLPNVQRFEVFALDHPKPAISVPAEALSLTRPVWESALGTFSAMPFSTFLPANFAARSMEEDARRAARSVAWIAVDDFLDALDSSADQWSGKDVALFARRVSLNILATQQCLMLVPENLRVRLQLVLREGRAMESWLQQVPAVLTWHDVDGSDPVTKFRFWWEVWGPVERLPTVTKESAISPDRDSRPNLQGKPWDMRWRTM